MLLGAAWLAVFGDKTPSGDPAETVAQPVERKSSQASAAVPAQEAKPAGATADTRGQLLQLASRENLIRATPASSVDVFSTRNWTPPPPPAEPVPEPAPTAPPLPYAYAGKMKIGGAWEVYLTRGEATYIVRQGSSLEGTYDIEKISPPDMTMKYRPLGQQQSMFIGEAEQ
jgi:hypothetical protein